MFVLARIEKYRKHADFFGTTHTSSSPIVHGIDFGSPKLMHPKIGTDTLRPLFPSRLYPHLVFSSEVFRPTGICEDILALISLKRWGFVVFIPALFRDGLEM